jgi:hypothetical protein
MIQNCNASDYSPGISELGFTMKTASKISDVPVYARLFDGNHMLLVAPMSMHLGTKSWADCRKPRRKLS